MLTRDIYGRSRVFSSKSFELKLACSRLVSTETAMVRESGNTGRGTFLKEKVLIYAITRIKLQVCNKEKWTILAKRNTNCVSNNLYSCQDELCAEYRDEFARMPFGKVMIVTSQELFNF